MHKHGASIGGPFTVLLGRRGVQARSSGLATAAEAVGPTERGAILTGVTKGGFSMLDLIEHVLVTTGPADVDVSTWTMGVYDADVLWRFAQLGTIRRFRTVLDPAFFGNRPEHSEPFIAAFGGESMRAVENHAKFTLVGNEDWKVTICGSMNLNRNKRLENFCLFEGSKAYDFYRRIVDAIFEQTSAHWTGKKRTQEEFNRLQFDPAAVGEADAVW